MPLLQASPIILFLRCHTCQLICFIFLVLLVTSYMAFQKSSVPLLTRL